MSEALTQLNQTRNFKKTSRFLIVIILYLSGTLLLAHTSNYNQGLVLVAVVFSILALSLDLVAGVLGLYSLGHAGLFAISAYSVTILINNYHWNTFLVLPVAIIACALVGIVIGGLSLRVSGLYFAITTFLFTLIMNVLLTNLSITGSYQGIPGPMFPNFGSGLGGLGTSLVWACSGALAIAVFVMWSIRRSSTYPVLLAVRDAEPFAASMGVKTSRTRVLYFALSAGLVGLAGWAFSFLGFINPGQFGGTASINILVMVIFGGMNTLIGPIVGATFISLFPVIVAWSPLWQEVIFGVIFVFVVVVVPEGFVGFISRTIRKIREGNSIEFQHDPTFDETSAVELLSISSKARRVEPIGDSPYALEVKDIDFSYIPGVQVLQNVSLAAKKGSIHGLIGPNGSGKSTLVNLIAGELQLSEGSILLNGHSVEKMHSYDRPKYGLMRTFQTSVMVKGVSTQANVGIGLYSRYKWLITRAVTWPIFPGNWKTSREIGAQSINALSKVGLKGNWPDTKVADSPHGVEQLTQLAAACVGQPSVLLLDEPLAGLSKGETQVVSDILRLLSASGVTVIVVEHQTRFIFDVCDEVTVIAAGRMVATGKASDVRVNDQVREVYLGQ